MDALKLGLSIKKLRLIKNLTQKDLAQNICSREYISQLEKGKRMPSAYILKLLSEKLCEDISFFTNLSDEFLTFKFLTTLETYVEQKKISELELIIASPNFSNYNSHKKIKLWVEGLIQIKLYKNYNSGLVLFSKAISSELNQNNINFLSKQLLSFLDLKILNSFFHFQFRQNNFSYIEALENLIESLSRKYYTLNHEIQIELILNLAYAHYHTNFYKKSSYFFDMALCISKKNNSSKFLIDIYYYKSLIFEKTDLKMLSKKYTSYIPCLLSLRTSSISYFGDDLSRFS